MRSPASERSTGGEVSGAPWIRVSLRGTDVRGTDVRGTQSGPGVPAFEFGSIPCAVALALWTVGAGAPSHIRAQHAWARAGMCAVCHGVCARVRACGSTRARMWVCAHLHGCMYLGARARALARVLNSSFCGCLCVSARAVEGRFHRRRVWKDCGWVGSQRGVHGGPCTAV